MSSIKTEAAGNYSAGDYIIVSSWNAYSIQAWPTVVILDKQGRIRWTHIGEGMYDEQEQVIQKLLAE